MLTRSQKNSVYLQKQLHLPDLIRVGSISPGLTRTEIVEKAFPEDPEFSQQIFSTFPCLETEDLVDLVEYLLSRPSHIQMQDLRVTHVHSGLQNNYSDDKSK